MKFENKRKYNILYCKRKDIYRMVEAIGEEPHKVCAIHVYSDGQDAVHIMLRCNTTTNYRVNIK
jgi:hypothetical protein